MLKSILKSCRFVPLHILLWGLVWLFYVYFFSYANNDEKFIFWFSNSLLPITITTTYIFAYLLIPKYLIPKKYIAFIAYSIATVICSVFIIMLVTFIIFVFLSNFDIAKMPLITRDILFVFVLVYLVTGLVSFVQLLRHHYIVGNRNVELENRLLEGKLQLKQKELQYLKQQIHPHFLFNTLNTLYGFALKKSKQTPTLILKLSNLLDYILNQIDKPTVALSEEVKYIESYIGLEQVRFRDTLQITFIKDVDNELMIPPMLFMAFVENAFKHGAPLAGFLKIAIVLRVKDNTLEFQIKNTIDPQKKTTESHGIGIQNTKKRLKTLYPDAHMLTIAINNNWYVLQLTINFD